MRGEKENLVGLLLKRIEVQDTGSAFKIGPEDPCARRRGQRVVKCNLGDPDFIVRRHAEMLDLPVAPSRQVSAQGARFTHNPCMLGSGATSGDPCSLPRTPKAGTASATEDHRDAAVREALVGSMGPPSSHRETVPDELPRARHTADGGWRSAHRAYRPGTAPGTCLSTLRVVSMPSVGVLAQLDASRAFR